MGGTLISRGISPTSYKLTIGGSDRRPWAQDGHGSVHYRSESQEGYVSEFRADALCVKVVQDVAVVIAEVVSSNNPNIGPYVRVWVSNQPDPREPDQPARGRMDVQHHVPAENADEALGFCRGFNNRSMNPSSQGNMKLVDNA